MSGNLTFNICGKKFVMPTTPDPLEFPWEKELKDYFPAKEKVDPKRKRFRMVKKKRG